MQPVYFYFKKEDLEIFLQCLSLTLLQITDDIMENIVQL